MAILLGNKQKRPVCPKDGSQFVPETIVPLVPGTVPVCPKHRPAHNVYVYCFFSCQNISFTSLRKPPPPRFQENAFGVKRPFSRTVPGYSQSSSLNSESDSQNVKFHSRNDISQLEHKKLQFSEQLSERFPELMVTHMTDFHLPQTFFERLFKKWGGPRVPDACNSLHLGKGVCTPQHHGKLTIKPAQGGRQRGEREGYKEGEIERERYIYIYI